MKLTISIVLLCTCNFILALGYDSGGDTVTAASPTSAYELENTVIVCVPSECDYYDPSDPANQPYYDSISTKTNGAPVIFSSLADLTNVTAISGFLILYGNITAEQGGLETLSSLKYVGGTLDVSYTDLTDFTGLNSLERIGIDFQIFENQDLLTFAGLESLTAIGGEWYVRINSNLQNCEGLSSLETIGGTFDLSAVSMETCELPALRSVGAVADFVGFYALDNFVLTTLNIPFNRTEVSQIYIVSNDELASFGQGLQQIEVVSNWIRLEGNGKIIDMQGLNALRVANYSMNIKENHSLLTLEGLESLEEVTENLVIYDNNNLTSLAALSSLQSLGGYLCICNNTMLPSSEVTSLEDQLTLSMGDNLDFRTTCIPTSDFNYEILTSMTCV